MNKGDKLLELHLDEDELEIEKQRLDEIIEQLKFKRGVKKYQAYEQALERINIEDTLVDSEAQEAETQASEGSAEDQIKQSNNEIDILSILEKSKQLEKENTDLKSKVKLMGEQLVKQMKGINILKKTVQDQKEKYEGAINKLKGLVKEKTLQATKAAEIIKKLNAVSKRLALNFEF